MKLLMYMTNKKRVFANTATCESGKSIIPLLHEWLYPQEGKGSSLNLNQDLLIHVSTCDPGYHRVFPICIFNMQKLFGYKNTSY